MNSPPLSYTTKTPSHLPKMKQNRIAMEVRFWKMVTEHDNMSWFIHAVLKRGLIRHPLF